MAITTENDLGHNTSVIVLNDALHSIKEDPAFGEKLADAVARVHRPHPGYGIDIASGSNVNAATVVETHHADYTTLLAFGGNCVTDLGGVYGYRHNEENVQVMLLKMLAEKLGYSVSKRKK